MPVSASRRVSDLPFATPSFSHLLRDWVKQRTLQDGEQSQNNYTAQERHFRFFECFKFKWVK